MKCENNDKQQIVLNNVKYILLLCSVGIKILQANYFYESVSGAINHAARISRLEYLFCLLIYLPYLLVIFNFMLEEILQHYHQ
jgi:hypothetical protein